MNIKNTQGFTLIELMIVVAIIAILAAIALPAYQDYLIRSQVSEGAVLADGSKTAIAEFYSNLGHFPGNQASAGLPLVTDIQGKYVTQVDATGAPGIITVTYGNSANAAIATHTLSFSAVTHVGSVEWHCTIAQGGSPVDNKYLPTSCR
jgi:type IV pilus assembly protein PilA